MREPFLEPLLRRMRIRKVLPTILRYQDCRLLDIGCGSSYHFLKTVEPYIASGAGIDRKCPEIKTEKLTTKQMTLYDHLPFEDSSFDVVTMLAVLEHMSNPQGLIKEIERVLTKGGRLVLTVPSKHSQPVLQFLSFKLRVVSEEEIRDHKQYYDRKALKRLFALTGLLFEKHAYFQFGMNNICVAYKG